MKTRFLLPALLLLGATNIHAQNSIIMPTINDVALTNFGTDGYPNSYTIDYGPYSTSGGNPQLSAMVVDDGVNPPTIFVNDQVSPLVPWVNAAIPAPAGSSPDVIIGNDLSNPGQYIAAVVTINGGKVFLYLYNIINVGTAAFAINGPYSTTVIAGPGATGPAHIDAIAESSIPYTGGLPELNKYIITYQIGPKIFGYFAALNPVPAVAPVTQVIAVGATLSSSDVAAVERINGTVFEDWGLFSYVDLTTNTLYYQEWNVTTGIVSPAVVYDNVHVFANPNPGTVSVERIDAIDDYNLNSTTGGNAYFTITAAAPAPGTSIWEYNNITGPLVANNITQSITLPNPGLVNQANTIPVVACGPGPFYSVGYYSLPSGGGGGQQGYFVTAVDWSTGLPTTDPNAYMINKTRYDPTFAPGLALSATCNNNTTGIQQLFAGWENYAFLYSKYSLANPYAYKHSPAQTVSAAPAGEWQLYPNPGNDVITITAPAGFKASEHTTYNIADLSGKTLQESNIKAANQEIDITNIPAGMYLLNISTNGASTKTIKFVKQ